MKIRNRLIFTFLLIVFLPMFAIGMSGYYNAEKLLKKEIFKDLKVVAENKETEILDYLDSKKQRAVDFASGRYISDEVTRIISIKDAGERIKAGRALSDHLKAGKKPLDPDIHEIHILDLGGRIIAGTDKASLGNDRDRNQPYFINGKKETYIQSPYVHEHHNVKHQFLPVATPIRDLKNNKVIGVLMNGYDLENIKALLSDVRGRTRGNITPLDEVKSLEVILFNHNKQMIASSKETAVEYIGREIETEPVLKCLNSAEEMNKEWTDYKGQTVWGASSCIHAAKDWRWVLVVKEDKEEAYSPVAGFRNLSLAIGLFTLILALLTALRMARSISRPIRALHKGTEIIGSGNLGLKVGTDARDEIGQLSRAFDSMTENLRTTTASRDELHREVEERKTAEKRLKASEGRLVKTQEISHVGSWELDITTNLLTWSDEVYRIFGLQPQEFSATYEAFIEAVHPEDRKAVDAAYSNSLKEGRATYEIEHRVVRKAAGEIRFVHEKCEHIKDETGKIIRSLGMVHDITERKKMEESLKASEEQFRRLFETTQDGLLLLDKQTGHIITVNPAIVHMLGRPEAEFTGKGLGEIGLLKGVTNFHEIMQLLEKTGFIHYDDVPVETGNGKSIDTEIYLIDRAKLIQCNVRDTTKRKLLENAMRDSEAFIKNILESVDEGFLIVDKDYRIISANRAYCEQVKAAHCDIIGRNCHEVSHHLQRPCFFEGEDCAPSHTFRTGMPYVALHTHFDTEGNPVYTETKSFAVRDASGEVTAVIETLNNITEKRKLEEQLRHAQKMEAIGTLAGGIAHDFNNMLNVIIGYGGLMQMRMKQDDPSWAQLKEMLAAGDRAAQLTKGLLIFSRKQVLELKPVNINELIDGFKKMLGRIIGEDIELRIKASDEALTVMADRGHLEQVLMNLCANARDAMNKGGLLSIETKTARIDSRFIKAHGYGEPGNYALISVTDTGTGMDDKTQARIFEPYFTTKEIGSGTGLGLSIVFGIVKQHKGYVLCYSEPGKGTTFKIYLPLVKMEGMEMEEPETAAPKGGTETVLVAEDDQAVRTLTKTTLESFGYTVVEATDGADAVAKFRENPNGIQLLVLDIMMPKENGREAYEDIKGIRPDIKAVFMSGYAADIIQSKGLIEEGMEFISKPVMPDELLKRVRETLDK